MERGNCVANSLGRYKSVISLRKVSDHLRRMAPILLELLFDKWRSSIPFMKKFLAAINSDWDLPHELLFSARQLQALQSASFPQAIFGKSGALGAPCTKKRTI